MYNGAMTARKILHLDLDAFFCAVEELHNPALVGRAFAVGGRPEERGVVASCSYPARRQGVHSAMPMSQALRACPGLLVVPVRHRLYRTMSQRVMERVHRLTAQVEQISIDEAFVDLSARTEEPEALARLLQQSIRTELGLPCSLGVATNKLVAKIANTVGKGAASGDTPPCAITVVAPGDEASFLAPLPCDALWGVGPKTAQRLADYGLRTIGDLARRSLDDFELLLGKTGRDLVIRAQGIDDRPVVTEREKKSISQETTFTRDVGDEAELLHTLHGLALGVARDLRRSGLCATTVRLKLRWSDFTTPTRQMSLNQPGDDGEQIYAVARQLFVRLWQPGEKVRLIGVGVSGLTDQPRQMGLFDPPDVRTEKLTATVSAMRARFGEKAIVRGSEMRRRRDQRSGDEDGME
ncbi:MAG: DNA polymerase IV [Caldilineaceae bacterium]|nr:DNA polymerase IV [Caldilineaceae bacterium]